MKETLPVLLLKKLSLLPLQEVRLELNNELSKKIIELGLSDYQKKVLVILPSNTLESSPSVKDLPTVGILAQIKTKLELPNGNYRVVIKGLNRVKILGYANDKKDKSVLIGSVKRLYIDTGESTEAIALKRKLIELTKKYIKINPESSNSIAGKFNDQDSLDNLTDIIANFVHLGAHQKVFYMNEFDETSRAKKLIEDLGVELEVIKLNNKLDRDIRNDFEREQKEYLIKSKIEKLNEELGITSSKELEISAYYEKIENLKVSSKTQTKLFNELKKYEFTPPNNPDGSVIRNYLDTVLSLPFNNANKEETSPLKAKNSLNKTHYGLEDVKTRITEYVALKAKNPSLNSPIICLVGAPGVGKTTIAKSISKALKREFFKISVGGLNDSAELLGHRRTYLGAAPGKIIAGIKKCGVNNPVILIDEVDKMVKDYKGDPASVLLDILDSRQNKTFTDNYIEEPFSLTDCLFILTANEEAAIPPALKDRLEIIHIGSYTTYDKEDMALNYLIPSIGQKYGLNKVKIKPEVILLMINNYTLESGVRELERLLDKVIRNSIINKINSQNLDEVALIKILGNPLYRRTQPSKQIGSSNIIGLSALGGHLIAVQSLLVPSASDLIITGQITPELKDHIYIVLSYLKANNLIDHKKLNGFGLHINLSNNYMFKGTSGSLGIAVSLLSLLNQKLIDPSYAFSGCLDLYGNIGAVAGIKEKVITAYNNKIKTIYLPLANQIDLSDIPEFILNEVDIHLVSHFSEVQRELFKKTHKSS